MAPNWKTKEQENWLLSRLPAFTKAQRGRSTNLASVTYFLEETYRLWFDKWPEPDPQPILKVRKKKGELVSESVSPIEEKRKSIRKWFYWKTKGRAGREVKAGRTWIKTMQKQLTNGGIGAPCNLLSLYHSFYKDKIGQAVHAKAQEQHATSRSEIMVIRQEVIKTMWANEEPAIRDQVEEVHQKQRADYSARRDDPETEAEEKAQPLPMDYHKNINALPSILKTTMDALVKSTGWIFVVAAGGPKPSDNGKIWTQSHSFAPENIENSDFRLSYPAFKANFETPFSDHIVRCFPQETRKAWILSNANDVDQTETPRETTPHFNDAGTVESPQRRLRRRPQTIIFSEDEEEDGSRGHIPSEINQPDSLEDDPLIAAIDSPPTAPSNQQEAPAFAADVPLLPEPSGVADYDSSDGELDYAIPQPVEAISQKGGRKAGRTVMENQVTNERKKKRSNASSRNSIKATQRPKQTPQARDMESEVTCGRGKRIPKPAKNANGDDRYAGITKRK